MKIYRPIDSIKRTATNKPGGYLYDVQQLGDMDGDRIAFSEDDYLWLVQKYSPEKYEIAKHEIERCNRLGLDQRGFSKEQITICENTCRKCEWFLTEIEKCSHPNCACPASRRRLRPWENLSACAAGLWPW